MEGELTVGMRRKVGRINGYVHYGNGAIEGTKAYKTVDGRCAIFKLHEQTKYFLTHLR